MGRTLREPSPERFREAVKNYRGSSAPLGRSATAERRPRVAFGRAEREPGVSTSKLVGFGALYFAQGIPLGIAAEYLPVALRQSHASYSLIAAVSWLQLPWALKVLWARAGDLPSVRAKARRLVLLLQLGLAAIVATYAAAPLASSRALWFTLTALPALFAATQDVLVDGLAVRSLGKEGRGL